MMYCAFWHSNGDMVIGVIELSLTVLSLLIWVGLLGFWGQFWRTDQRLGTQGTDLQVWPTVCAIIPARNEAALLPVTLRSLLQQDYPGAFRIILVDDHSTDGTASIARDMAQTLNTFPLEVFAAESLPPGWTGKLWAIEQGVHQAQTASPQPDFFLFTDADIEHDPVNLRRLVTKAQQEDLDLVSLMVRLRCQSVWEHLLIPAFVFFFQKLYPFRWVNDPTNPTAASAGGCTLIRQEALVRIGGVQCVRQALIDDCALAQAVKSTPQPLKNQSRIWLGLADHTRSLRPYASLSTIWEMIARTAFTQLKYSPLLLLGTLIGMPLVYIIPPVGFIWGLLTGNALLAIAGLAGWLLMALAYLPILLFYQCSVWLAFCLPVIALLYTLMTLDSAWRHWQGRGGYWKGRVYPEKLADS